MHRVILTKLLLRIKLKHDNCYCCVRMHSNIVPWRESVTGYYSTDFKFYKKLVADNLGVDRDRAAILLRNNLRIIGIPQERIVKNCRICQNQEVDLQSNIRDLKFLELTEDDLENRILLLKEMGAEYINTAMLRTCASRVHVVTFKAYTRIPPDQIISNNLSSHLHPPPPDIPSLNNLNDYMTVKEYRKRCLTHWIKWRLDINDSNDRLIDGMFNRLKYKSFSRLRKCFDILHKDLEMPIELIRDKKCLNYTSTAELQNILANVPVICGVSVKDLLKQNLRLLKMKYMDVLIAKEALEDFGITSEQLLKTSNVLLLSTDTLEVGLEMIKTTPQLKVLIDHPSLLQILMTKDGVQRRIDYLRYLSINDATVNVLGKSVNAFDRYLRTGTHRLKGGEMSLMLVKYFNKDTLEIQEKMKRHTLWKHVDLLTMHRTLQYLMINFCTEDIYKNLQLLLYSKDKVESVLSKLIEMNKQIDDYNRYTQSQLLALCSYEIEREFHFTGDGVWDKSKQSKNPKNCVESSQETDDNFKNCQKKYPVDDVNTLLFINTNKTQRLP